MRLALCSSSKLVSILLSLITISSVAIAYQDSIQHQGINIDIAIDPVGNPEGRDAPLIEGDKVVVRFKFSDTRTGKPYRGANPAAWVDRSGIPQKRQCSDRARRYLSSSLFDKPVLDLNVFYVLALNADPTITVVDPLFGFGGTKLLALIGLKSPGEDWVIAGDDRYLYVSMPESNGVTVIDTDDWSVARTIQVGDRPRRIALQPDGAYLWVSTDEANPTKSGLDVIRVSDGQLLSHIATAAGSHELAFTPDSKFAFVTNSDAASVSLIDIRNLIELKEISTGDRPVSVAYSNLAQAAYVAHQGDGKIVVIDGQRHTILEQSPRAEPGLVQIRMTPDGRFALAPNPERNTVAIIDTASNRLIHSAHVLDGPDQISFTVENAYIRHRNSEVVLILPLGELGKSNTGVAVVDFPGGQHPLGKTSRPSLADAIVQASGHYAVLVTNPSDESIYYYKEGMAAPMGTFSNYGREPRATLVVERNLRELKVGEYQTSVTLPEPGDYNIVFYLNVPEIVHCFNLTVTADPNKVTEQILPLVKVQVENSVREGLVNEPINIEFRLTEGKTGRPITHLRDLSVLVFSPAWQNRFNIVDGSDGVYVLDTKIPVAGTYAVALNAPSQGINGIRYLWLTIHPSEQ